MEKARKLTYMHNTPKTPSQTTPQKGERILSLLESFEIFGGFFPMFLSVLNRRQKEVFILGVGELGLGLQVLWDFRNLDFLTGKHGVQGQIEWRKSEAKMEGNLEIIVQLLIGTWFQISMIFPFFISSVFVFNSDVISSEFSLSILF